MLSVIVPGEPYYRSYHKTKNLAEDKKTEIEVIWWEKAKSPGISKGDFERANLALLELENTSYHFEKGLIIYEYLSMLGS